MVHASAECLKVVLSTKAGSDALARAVHEAGGDESRWCSLLEPFKQQKKKSKVMLMHQSEYSANSKSAYLEYGTYMNCIVFVCLFLIYSLCDSMESSLSTLGITMPSSLISSSISFCSADGHHHSMGARTTVPHPSRVDHQFGYHPPR